MQVLSDQPLPAKGQSEAGMDSHLFMTRRGAISSLLAIVAACYYRERASAAPGMLRITAGACGFGNSAADKIVPVAEDAENAIEVITKICSSVALPPNFTLVAVTDPSSNAYAEIVDTDRYIIYDRSYMLSVSTDGLQSWPALAVIAHEVGHHLCGHTLKTDGSRPPLELEADHFAGFALACMGAPRTEAFELWQAIIPSVASPTHPPRQERVEAVTSGWIVATGRRVGKERHTLISANKNSLGTYDRVVSIFDNNSTFWQEWQHGQPLATFVEINRTPDSVYLYDDSREIPMTVRLDISFTGGVASGYWTPGRVHDLSVHWIPLDPKFWPDGMRASDMIKD